MRLAYLTSHPIQYQAPLFRRLAAYPGLEFEALFCHDHGVRPSFDPGFGREIQYDVPLVEGYHYRFLANRAPRPGPTPAGQINPEIVRILARGEFDAIIVHGYAAITNLLALAAPRARGTRLLLRGDTNLLPPRSVLRRATKQVLLRGLFKRVDHFLAVGTLNRRYYEAYGVSPVRITLAPHSIDNAFFAVGAGKGRSQASFRQVIGLPTDRPVFLFCAKLVPVKRPLDVIRALAVVRRALPCALAIVGDGPLRESVHAEAHRLGVTPDVHLLGFRNQSELPAIYAACDALILPSSFEPWGLVVNEAMACGLPVAVSDQVGAAPDLVKTNGAVFRCGDIEGLADIMRAWGADAALRRCMGEASTRLIREWSIERTAEGMMAGIRASLARPRQREP